MSILFKPYHLKNLELQNRVVMAPMCMYSTDTSGMVQDFHRIHYGSRAVGGAGLILVEATAVLPLGRISDNDLGLWSDEQVPGHQDLVRLMQDGGAMAGIQLAHAGRKYETEDSRTVAPSSIDFSTDYLVPDALTEDEIRSTVLAFRDAARRASDAGYDTIEIHGAHGYLIHQFLSPLSNHRTDHYGGSFRNRLRFLNEVIDAIRSVWPADKALLLRLSATDYLPGGIDIDSITRVVDETKDRIDLFHISSGGLLPAKIDTYPGYQVDFSKIIKERCGVRTIAVGLVTDEEQAVAILETGAADLIGLGRLLLRDPYWPLRHSAKIDRESIPEAYRRGF